MTRKELIEMCGSEDQANFAMDILLKNVKPALVASSIRAEIAEADAKIREFKSLDFICTCNGVEHVNWGKAEELNGYHLSEEGERQYNEACEKCNEAEALLFRRNRLVSMIAVR